MEVVRIFGGPAPNSKTSFFSRGSSRCIFGRCAGHDIECVEPVAKLLIKKTIHKLMTTDRAQAFKVRGDDTDLKVCAAPLLSQSRK